MHVILKYNDNVYNVDTIKEHKDVLETNGKVIWGVIKPNKNSPGIAATRINKIKTQIANGEEVYAYLVTKGEIIARVNVIDILYTSEVENNKWLFVNIWGGIFINPAPLLFLALILCYE
jgi:hypothetical protein